MNVTSFRIHDDQVELLDVLCSQLRCSRSFFIRQLIDNCSPDLFEKINQQQSSNITTNNWSTAGRHPHSNHTT